MLTGAIDFYHFIPFSLALALARGQTRGHKVSTKQNLLALLFFSHFSIVGMKIDVFAKLFKLNILILL